MEEALAESYGEIAHASKSIDGEIDKALAGSGTRRAAANVQALKTKLGRTE